MKHVIVITIGCVLATGCVTERAPPAASLPAPSAPQPPSLPARPSSAPPSATATVPRPDSALANTAAGRAQAQTFVRQSYELLDRGEEESARRLLEQAVALDTENKAASCLLRGIRADPVATLGNEATTYVVRPGDTLGSIAKRALGDPCDFYILARYNQIKVPHDLHAGQVIKVPGRTPLDAAPVLTRPSAPPPPRPAAARKPETPEVTIPPAPPAAAEANASPAATDDVDTRALIERHHRNALAAFRRQDLDTAIREWDKVLELDPTNDLARARRQEALDLDKRFKQLK